MATTPEEQEPPSPSVFLNLPPTPPHGDGDPSAQLRDDPTLDYISRMLMEEDIVDKFLYQYPDNPALLQAQQPFAQILSASSTIASSDAQQQPSARGKLPSTLLPAGKSVNTDSSTHVRNPAFLYGGTDDDAVEPHGSACVSPGEGSTRMHMLSSMAFFKGVEEANKLLPRDNAMVDGRGRKNRFDGDEETEAAADVGRSSKQMAVLVQQRESEEEAAARDMLDQLMLNSHDMYPSKAHELQVTVEKGNEAAEQQSMSICRRKAPPPRARRSARQAAAVTDLHKLLIRCAEAVANNDRGCASELLERIKRQSSPTGDAAERMAHYFAEGLEARLAGTGSLLYRSLMARRISLVSLLKGLQLHMSASCFVKLTLLFSNKIIYNAVAGRKRLHIVQYGASSGFQWPDFLRWLANREDGPPEVRLTGINGPQHGFHPAEQIEEAGRRLRHCASQFGVPFKFRAIAAKSEDVTVEDLDIDPDEVLVVNSLFHFRTLMDESVVVEGGKC